MSPVLATWPETKVMAPLTRLKSWVFPEPPGLKTISFRTMRQSAVRLNADPSMKLILHDEFAPVATTSFLNTRSPA
jgi:hypothetical protein